MFKALVFVVGNKRRIARRKTLLPLWEAWFRLGIVLISVVPRIPLPVSFFTTLRAPCYTFFPLVEPPRRCKLSFLYTSRAPKSVYTSQTLNTNRRKAYVPKINRELWKLWEKSLNWFNEVAIFSNVYLYAGYFLINFICIKWKKK